MNLLANACLYPGFLSFIQHIVSVDSEEDLGDLNSVRMGGEWAMEYAESTRVHINRVALSPAFHGMKFRDVAEVLYREVGEKRPRWAELLVMIMCIDMSDRRTLIMAWTCWNF